MTNENNINVTRNNDTYEVTGTFHGTLADLCQAIEAQKNGQNSAA